MAAVVCAAFVACKNTGKTANNANSADSVALDSAAKTDTVRYEGVLPAADSEGIKYNVAIVSKDSTVEYTMKQTYLGTKDGDQTFETNGRVESITEQVDGKEVHAMRLVGKTEADDTYLLFVDGETVRVVGKDLKSPQDTKLNYDLKVVK